MAILRGELVRLVARLSKPWTSENTLGFAIAVAVFSGDLSPF